MNSLCLLICTIVWMHLEEKFLEVELLDQCHLNCDTYCQMTPQVLVLIDSSIPMNKNVP